MDIQLSYFILGLYDEARDAPVSEFAERSLNKMKQLLNFDSAGMASFVTAPDGQINPIAAYVYKQPQEKIWYRHSNVPSGQRLPNGQVICRDPMVGACWAARGISHHMSLGDLSGDEGLKTYGKKFETQQILTIAMPSRDTREADFISLWRAGSKKLFEDRDAGMANLLLPHLQKSIQINRQLAGPKEHADTVIYCSMEGYIHFLDEVTITVLQQEWREWTPPILPPILMQGLLRSDTYKYLGRAIMATLQKLRGMIVMTVVRNPIGAMLTRTELQVALLVSEGKSYKEIARVQAVSPATIRNQLHSIYAKIGISGKVELVKALGAQAI